ncbi:DUF6265 family protein [Aliiglaciecola sp. LCG003]|uniref:DUF6265 family protein n=1 Tax=Aliiglaciecola sp. LCG003 TaxID=3053655 RepID=UPI0025728C14|nr:DUF6265 family protein [Aliiglaciecola sp. LCG003]WJG09285.1 DUF6265 family protein [Aliiglaciecola sp. LCG003]
MALRFSLLLCLLITSDLQAQCNSLDSLDWILGTWHSQTEKDQTWETWQRATDNTFEGKGETHSAAAIHQEQLRLINMNGEIFYLAKVPSNNLPVAFKLESCESRTAKFVNFEHDFPQILEYHINQDNELVVSVSSTTNQGFVVKFQQQL